MSPFPIRMTFNFKSVDPRDLDMAVRLGFNWVYTGWLGHNECPPDDQPMLFEHDPRVADLRRPRFPTIRQKIDALKKYHNQAHERGLKVALFTYEPSVPAEIRQAYPEAFYPYPKAFLDRWPKDADKLHMCIYDARTQEWIAEKVNQTIRNIGPIDAWIYTTAEAMWGSNLNRHVCANCWNQTRWESVRLLRNAMQEGIRRSGQNVLLIHRFWGTQHPDEYQDNAKNLLRLTPHDNQLQSAVADTLEKRSWQASRDLPPFYESLKKEQGQPMVISKATWTDFLLHQPPNPWVGRGRGKIREIIELSLEPCHQKYYGFIPCALVKQIQNHLQYGLERGCEGVMRSPLEGDKDWGLNLANLEIGMKLIDDPQADLKKLTAEWSRQHYEQPLPEWLIEGWLNSEDIWGDIMSYNGMSNLMNFDTARWPWIHTLGISKYYMWPMFEAFPDHEQRFDLTQEGMSRAIATWNRRVRQAKQLNDRVRKEIESIPQAAREHVTHYFDRLAALTLLASLLQKLLFVRMALEFKKMEPSMQLMRLTERWDFQVYYMIATDPEIQQNAFVKPAAQLQMSGWRYPDVTEIDAFPGIGDAREIVVNDFVGEWAECMHEVD